MMKLEKEHIGLIIIYFINLFFISSWIFKFPLGTDAGHHLYNFYVTQKTFKENGFFPFLSENTNNGSPFFLFYPSLTYIIGTFISFFTNIENAYRLFMIIIYPLISIAFYFFLKELKIKKLTALITAFAYSLSPSLLMEIGIFTTYVGHVSLFFFFISLIFLVRLIKKENFKNYVLASITLSLSFLAHYYTVVAYTIFIISYLIACFFEDKKFDFKLLKRVSLVYLLTFLLVSFKLMPILFNLNYLKSTFSSSRSLFSFRALFMEPSGFFIGYFSIVCIAGIFIGFLKKEFKKMHITFLIFSLIYLFLGAWLNLIPSTAPERNIHFFIIGFYLFGGFFLSYVINLKKDVKYKLTVIIIFLLLTPLLFSHAIGLNEKPTISSTYYKIGPFYIFKQENFESDKIEIYPDLSILDGSSVFIIGGPGSWWEFSFTPYMNNVHLINSLTSPIGDVNYYGSWKQELEKGAPDKTPEQIYILCMETGINYLIVVKNSRFMSKLIGHDNYFEGLPEKVEQAVYFLRINNSEGFVSVSKDSLVHDFKRKSPHEISFNIQTPSEIVLDIKIMYFPWWKCFIDNKETKISKNKYGFMEINVPTGSHSVSFKFLPGIEFWIGVFISVFSLIFLIFYKKAKYYLKTVL